jgi:hypothetical protein
MGVSDYSLPMVKTLPAPVSSDHKVADDRLTDKSPAAPAVAPASSTSRAPAAITSMSWARMSFEVDLSNRSVKLTLSDRNSGEVYRELVYDRGGLLRTSMRPGSGQWIDRSV